MTTRRELLLASVLSAIAPARAIAQARRVRVGMLSAITKSFFAPIVVQRLGELGYREGSTMVFEFRSAEGKPERYPLLAKELLELKCDLIFAIGAELTARALHATPSNVPVVFLAVDYDPLEKGFVASLARPGGNMTGVYTQDMETTLKRLEISREILPGASRFLVLSDVYNGAQLTGLKKAADSRQTQLTVVEFKQQPYDYEAALETGRRSKSDALILLSSPILANDRAQVLAAAISKGMPIIGFATPEALFPVGYSANPTKLAHRAAEIGVQILKGAKPAEIPVERAGEFDLQVNLQAAKTLGMKIPYSVLARATKVIE